MTLKTYKNIAKCQILGVESLPVHWSENKLGYLFNLGKGLTITKQDLVDEGIPCLNYGEVHSKYGFEVNPTIHPLKYVPQSYIQSNPSALLQYGDFVFADTSEDIQGAGNFSQLISATPTFAGYHTIIARPVGTNFPRFFAYLFHSEEFRNQIRLLVKGVKVFSISQGILKSASVWLPSKDEQQKIAQFLDYETTKIDALIDEQKRLIELLKEKRQAVISHAVTKGLNPHTPMKDSGVEWLGEVPEHWDIVKLKYLIHGLIDTEHKTVPFDDEGEFFVARTSDIRGGKLDLNGAKRTNQSGYIEWTKRGAPKKGDIIFTREAPAGEACIVPIDDRICLGQRTVLIKLNESSLASGFALWSLYGGLASRFITELSQGSTVSHINMADIPNIPVLLPSLDEQKDIDAYLKSVTDKYDSLKAHSEQLMTRLHERRSALISAAVTGKIDVRDWHPPAGSDTVDSNASVQTERHYG